MLVDTHCHLFNEYYDDIEEVIKRAISAGVSFIVVNGVDRRSNEEILKLVMIAIKFLCVILLTKKKI